jgi:poly-gamma-glutamate synthase PgsB/CapB
VQEQLQIFRTTARAQAGALSLECMSITPEYQKLESRLFEPQFYVITNIKDDHREKMGSTLEEQAQAMCEAIPANCTVVTSEVRHLDVIREVAEVKGSPVVLVPAQSVPAADLPQHVFNENVLLALRVCELAGCDSDQALAGIRSCAVQKKSPLSVLRSEQGQIHFLDGFDVNDVFSAQEFLLHWQKIAFPDKIFSVLLHTRSDRPTRSVQFAGWLAHAVPYLDKVFLSGTHMQRTEKELLRAGMDAGRIVKLHAHHASGLQAEILNCVEKDALVVGLGNIAGLGLEFRKMLAA